MAEVSVFDAYQVQRVLRGHLAEGDALETLARDDATGAFWVLTGRELIVVRDQQISDRMAIDGLTGEVETTDAGVTVRVRGGDTSKALIGTFRKAGRFTRSLAALLAGDAR